MSFIRTNRKIHKWGSIIVALPLLIVIISGILLLVRKEFAYLQPETKKGLEKVPVISFEQIINQAKSVEQAQVNSWQDIDRLDVRPNKGVIKIRTNSQWEIQLDSTSAEILQVAYRRSDFIESLSSNEYFHKASTSTLSYIESSTSRYKSLKEPSVFSLGSSMAAS
mgnify:CR=1 FL=1